MKITTIFVFALGVFVGTWASYSDAVHAQIKRTGKFYPLFYDNDFECKEIVNSISDSIEEK